MSSSDAVHAVDSTADAAFTAVKTALADATVGDISNEAVQKLMTAAAKLYCAKLTEDQGYFGPFLEARLSPRRKPWWRLPRLCGRRI